ncbi:hypothetical protein HDU98_001758 [Podochytrium sp. JEL0797]|nr:hypothetical protein HDU98_001758 [Podochytrium sp. JEL0797]
MPIDLPFAEGDHISNCTDDDHPERSFSVDVFTLLQVLEPRLEKDAEWIPVSTFNPDIMNGKCWGDKKPASPADFSNSFSPQQLLDDPSISPLHWAKLEKCDIQYPILILEHADAVGTADFISLVDGMHRLVKCVQQKMEKVNVIKVSKEEIQRATWPKVASE